jgi:hypothetical protein
MGQRSKPTIGVVKDRRREAEGKTKRLKKKKTKIRRTETNQRNGTRN